MTSNKYIALTLGPIFRTIQMAETTRALWASSYLFSFLAKKIIEPFKERKFLLPIINDEMFTSKHNGAGIFPDRYIFQAEEQDFERLKARRIQIIDYICGQYKTLIEEEDFDNLRQYFANYFKIYFFEKDFDKSDQEIVRECEKTLSLLEMQDSFPPFESDDKQYMTKLLNGIMGKPYFVKKEFKGFKGSFLTDDAFAKGEFNGFESIIQISAAEYRNKFTDEYYKSIDDTVTSSELNKKLLDKVEKSILSDIKPYNKYIAIVKADGDNMGKTIESCKDFEKISQALLDFSKKVPEVIIEYGGKPIYIGGDDLFFFAPIKYKEYNLFDLIHKLDDIFNACFKESLKNVANEVQYPTLSFGISISYYKYPLFESVDVAEKMLFCKAKNGSLKNNIVVSMRKHSGQMLTMFIHKGIKTYKLFKDLLDNYISIDATEDSLFLSSVMFKLREFEDIFRYALNDSQSETIISNLFSNNFNESVHAGYTHFFDDISRFIVQAYRDNKAIWKEIEPCMPEPNSGDKINTPEKLSIEMAYSTLRFIHFINTDKDE